MHRSRPALVLVFLASLMVFFLAGLRLKHSFPPATGPHDVPGTVTDGASVTVWMVLTGVGLLSAVVIAGCLLWTATRDKAR